MRAVTFAPGRILRCLPFALGLFAGLGCAEEPRLPGDDVRPPPPVSTRIDPAALRLAIARYAAANGATGDDTRFRERTTDLDGDGREDALVYFDTARWCGESGCTLAVFQSIPEGVRFISDMPRVLPRVFVHWSRHRGWRDLWIWEGESEARPEAQLMAFGGRGYPRYPQEDTERGLASDASGAMVRFEGEVQQAVEPMRGHLRVGRSFQLFRPCGSDTPLWALDATADGLHPLYRELVDDPRRGGVVDVEALIRSHPLHCTLCQGFEASVMIFRIARAVGSSCPGGAEVSGR